MSDPLFVLVVTAAILAGAFMIWKSSLDAREMANRIARDACSRAVVQFLDHTVAFSGLRWQKDSRGRRRLLRTYTFDYSADGFVREQGFIVLSGLRLESVGLAGAAS